MHEVLRLHGLGFHLVPWLNRNAVDRKPLVKGFTDATYSTETTQEFITKWPEADWAIVPRGCVVLDVDIKSTDGHAELVALCKDHGSSLEELTAGTCATKTFSNGRHFWFKTDANLPSCHIGQAVELKHLNSVHVPPSMGYEWIRQLGPAESLPDLPEWLMKLWVAKSQEKSQREYIQPRFVNGSRHSALVSFAGKARDSLALSQVELNELLKVVRKTRCEDPDTVEDTELDKIAEDIAKFDPTDVQGLAIAGDEGAKSIVAMFNRTGVAIEASPGSIAYSRVTTIDESLLYPTPMIEKWVKWINSTNHRPQPEVALAGVLTAIGSIIGRNILWKDTPANIYTLALAASGTGKNACRVGVEKVMKAIGCVDRLGAGDFGSDSGFREELSVKKEMLMVADEFHRYMEKLGMSNCPPYIAGINGILLEAFSGDISGKCLKGVTIEPIEAPHFSMFALCQPSIFWACCKQKQTENGFLGRMIVFNGRPMPKDCDASRTDPPEDLVELIKTGYTARTLVDQLGSGAGERREIEADDVCHVLHRKLREHCDNTYTQRAAHEEHNVSKATLYSRTFEKANRLALIHAWSLNPAAPKMTVESIQWAYDLMIKCNEYLLNGMSDHVSVNSNEENVKRIFKLIRDAGQDGILKAALVDNTKGIGTKQRMDIIDDLREAGKIEIGKKKVTEGRGTASTMYRIIQGVES